MSVRIHDFEILREQIQARLVDYLTQKSVQFLDNGQRRFRCITGTHEDAHPSANIIPRSRGIMWKCHACGASGDIFDAAHFLDKKPVGPDEAFYTETVPFLCETLGIEFSTEPMTEEDAFRFKARRAYQMAACLVSEGDINELFTKELEFRGWDHNHIRDIGVGQVTDYGLFKTVLLKHFSEEFLQQIGLVGLGPERLFGSERMTFTLFDHKRRPVGFAARNLRYKEEGNDDQKYYNTTNTLLFQKGNYLYGIDGAAEDKDNIIYVFEGQADVVSYRTKLNRKNCVGLCGSAFTDGHIDLLREVGINRICICMDGDNAGRQATAKIVASLSCNPGLAVSVMTLPSGTDEKDLDAFLRKHGSKGWDEARTLAKTAFAWRLANRQPDEPVDKFIQEQVNTIINEADPIKSWRLIEELAHETNVPVQVIQDKVDFQRDHDRALLEQKRKVLADQLARAVQQNPDEGMLAIAKYQSALETVERTHKADFFDPAIQQNLVLAQRERQLHNNPGSYIKLGWKIFDQKTQGLPSEDIILFVGGKSNVGKTSLFANWAVNILQNNQDVIVVCMTIDDSHAKFVPRMVSYLSGLPTTPWIVKPNAAYRELGNKIPKELLPFNRETNQKFKNREEIIEHGNKAYATIEAFMKNGQLRVIDSPMTGGRLSVADKALQRLRRAYPTAKIVLFLDNFHNLEDFSENGSGQGREKWAALAQQMRNIATRDRILIFSTIEYIKMQDGTKPSNNNLAESRRMEYISDGVIHLVNHSHEFRNRPRACVVNWVDTHDVETRVTDGVAYPAPKVKPVVEMMFGKSKINSFKGSIFTKFNPDLSTFIEATEAEQDQFLARDLDQPWKQD